MKKALLTRFGGMGDNAPLTVVGKQLKKQGYHVTVAVRNGGEGSNQAEMFKDNPCFDVVLEYIQVNEPIPMRGIKGTFAGSDAIIDIRLIFDDFDFVVDYMNIIENNNTSPVTKNNPASAWEKSRSSNWVNWYDLHLAWANIDPTSVSDEDKRPVFVVKPEEKAFFDNLKQEGKLVVMQTSASSLSRTWYAGKHFVGELLKAYPTHKVAFWDSTGNTWVLVTSNGVSPLKMPPGSPLRASMALVAASDVFIGADSGFMHVAEALGIPHVAIYSTVPAWTRAKYYKNQIAIDPGKENKEYWTFNLGLGDPLRVIEGENGFTDRQKKLSELYDNGVPSAVASSIMNTTIEGLNLEFQALMQLKKSFEHQQSKALSTVTPKAVLEAVKGIL